MQKQNGYNGAATLQAVENHAANLSNSCVTQIQASPNTHFPLMVNNAAEVRAQCIANSERLLTVAERELSHGVDHICFHLALLALEEIGKGILATASFAASHAGKDSTRLVASFDDHVKKAFLGNLGRHVPRQQFHSASNRGK